MQQLETNDSRWLQDDMSESVTGMTMTIEDGGDRWLQTIAENCFVPDRSGVVTARAFVTVNLLIVRFEMSVYCYSYHRREPADPDMVVLDHAALETSWLALIQWHFSVFVSTTYLCRDYSTLGCVPEKPPEENCLRMLRQDFFRGQDCVYVA